MHVQEILRVYKEFVDLDAPRTILALRKEKALEMKKEDLEGKPDQIKEKIVTQLWILWMHHKTKWFLVACRCRCSFLSVCEPLRWDVFIAYWHAIASLLVAMDLKLSPTCYVETFVVETGCGPVVEEVRGENVDESEVAEGRSLPEMQRVCNEGPVLYNVEVFRPCRCPAQIWLSPMHIYAQWCAHLKADASNPRSAFHWCNVMPGSCMGHAWVYFVLFSCCSMFFLFVLGVLRVPPMVHVPRCAKWHLMMYDDVWWCMHLYAHWLRATLLMLKIQNRQLFLAHLVPNYKTFILVVFNDSSFLFCSE